MQLTTRIESWPLAQPFVISRGSRTAAEVVVARLEGDGTFGRGECVPYARYGESPASVAAELDRVATGLNSVSAVRSVMAELKPGAARCALNGAWLDWQCKSQAKRITDLLGVASLQPVVTAYTISIAAPEEMHAAALTQAQRPLLKIKTGADNVIESVRAVRQAAPQARLIVDANEAWPVERLEEYLAAMAELSVSLVEQPLPAGEDEVLADIDAAVDLYADESFHTLEDVQHCSERYQGINIKLDKTGGLSDALEILTAARKQGLKVMCGCMVGTSLSMAPAMVLAQVCDFVDLDAPLLLAEDRDHSIRYEGSLMHPYSANLWG